jgi:hypothetical protein
LPEFPSLQGVPRLDAGADLTVTGPAGQSVSIPKSGSGSYLYLGASIPGLSQSAPFLDTGTYRIQGRGGSQVGPFDVNVTLRSPLIWTNRDQTNAIVRSQGLRMDWVGGSSDQVALIFGIGSDQRTKATTTFFCLADAGPGTFTVPASALYNLPTSGNPNLVDGGAALGLVGLPLANFATFSASGLDLGLVIPASLDSRLVEVR